MRRKFNLFFFLPLLKKCEQELNRLKILLDENCRMLKNENMNTGEVTRSLADELTEVREMFLFRDYYSSSFIDCKMCNNRPYSIRKSY